MRRSSNNVVQSERVQEKSLQELEKQVSASLQQVNKGWRETGLGLGEIRDRRLYLPQTFEEYLASKSVWKITRRHADRLIKSARAAQNVLESKWTDWLPEVPNEGVARELAKLPEEQQAERWKTAYEESAGLPTAAILKKVATFQDDDEDDEDDDDVDMVVQSSKRKVKGGSSDLSKTSGTSPPKYKIAVNCELIDIEEVSEIVGCFESSSSAKGDKHTLHLDRSKTGTFLRKFGQTFPKFKGTVAISVKGVAA